MDLWAIYFIDYGYVVKSDSVYAFFVFRQSVDWVGVEL